MIDGPGTDLFPALELVYVVGSLPSIRSVDVTRVDFIPIASRLRLDAKHVSEIVFEAVRCDGCQECRNEGGACCQC